MNWFKRHLNWTLGFSVISSIALAIPLLIDEFIGTITPLAVPIAILGLLIYFITGGFVLKQKGRSLWYLALAFIPYIGSVVAPTTWLVLSNVSRQRMLSTSSDRQAIVPPNQLNEYNEQKSCLTYYQEELSLGAFQTKEADKYNEAVVKYGTAAATDSEAVKELSRAANRLAQAAGEIIKRRRIMTIPGIAAAIYSIWNEVYHNYASWASAQAAAVSSLANGMVPRDDYVKRLHSEAEKSRRKAEKEEKRFVRRLELTAWEIQGMLNKASAEAEHDNWQPAATRNEGA